MECKTCGYALWNLPDRTCPECGSPFKPSDFDFRPGTVRFHCPHCRQEYYGTDARGHLVPPEFDCVSCGQPARMDEMLLLPAEGVDEDQTAAHDQPWLDRRRRGFFRAWWQTVVMSLIRPTELMRASGPATPAGSAWVFALNNMLLVFLAGLALSLACIGLMVGFVNVAQGGGGIGTGGAGLGPMFGMQFITQGASLVFMLLFLGLWILSAHAILRITGGCEHTMGVTAQAILYASGTYLVSLVPCVGSFAVIWWFVSAILMLRVGQGVSGGRATLAVLALPITAILAGVALYILFFVALINSTGPFGTATTWTAHDTLQHLAVAAEDRATDTGSGWDHTDHGLLLLVDGYAEPWDYVADMTPTVTSNVPLAAGTLADHEDTTAEQRAALAETITPLPQDVVAHRVGDFVFTWHGIDAADPPPGLWIIVEHDFADAGSGFADAHAIAADGSIQTLYTWSRAPTLQAQNDLRALHGLPPLPDPTMVTQDEPATAGP